MTLPIFTETPVVASAGQSTGTPAKTSYATSGEVQITHAGVAVLEIHVVGLPAPQGSKKGFVNPKTQRVVVVEQLHDRIKTWRGDVREAAQTALVSTPDYQLPDPRYGVELHITFLMPRPKSHYRTGRNAHLLRDAAPVRPTGKPDLDKLLRSTCDALKVARVYRDDSEAVSFTARKVYTTGHPGAVIHVYAGGPT